MERKITITYSWMCDDNSEIPTNHIAALEETAETQINAMMAEGYTSGEFRDNIRMTDTDPKEGIEYSGLWSRTTENTSTRP